MIGLSLVNRTVSKLNMVPLAWGDSVLVVNKFRSQFYSGAYGVSQPNNALNYRSLRSLDSQPLRVCLPVSLVVRLPMGTGSLGESQLPVRR